MPDRTQDELAAYTESVKELEEWGDIYADRDNRIHRARKAGLSQAEVARRMRISRDAVIRAWDTPGTDGGAQR